jgi:hypothetical protein
MGAPEKFTKEQSAWIESTMSDFLQKLGKQKPRVPGQPEPSDDTDLPQWQKQKWDEFEKKFGEELQATGTPLAKWHEVSVCVVLSCSDTYFTAEI